MRLKTTSNTVNPIGLHLALSVDGVDRLIERLMALRNDPTYTFRLGTSTTTQLISIEVGRLRPNDESNANVFDSDRRPPANEPIPGQSHHVDSESAQPSYRPRTPASDDGSLHRDRASMNGQAP